MFSVPFVYFFYPFPPEPPEARKRDLLKMTPIPACLPGPSVDGCVTVCVLFGDKLAFFLFFKQPLIILSAYPLEQSAFDSRYMASGCLYPRWQRETERTAQPILAIPASGWGGSLLLAPAAPGFGFQKKQHLYSLPPSWLAG